MNRLGLISLTIAMIIATLACQRRPLYAEGTGHTVKIKIDWSDFPERPSGMTLVFFDEDNVRTQIVTHSVDSLTVTLDEGHWRVYAFNQSVSEFGSLSFSGMESYDTPLASIARIYESKWRPSSADDSDRIVVEPEHLGVATGEFYVRDDKEMTVPLKIEDATMDLNITVHISGVSYLYQTRGAISGLAEGYYLTKGCASDREVTQLLEDWIVYLDENNPNLGYAKLSSEITTFGLPGVYRAIDDISSRAPESNVFTIDFLLRDRETTKTHYFNVGDQFSITYTRCKSGDDIEPRMHISLNLMIGYDEPIELPYVPPAVTENQSSGFDATVEDWDLGGIIDISM